MAVQELIDSRAQEFAGRDHQMLIGGEWVDAASGETFETINPATEEVLSHVPKSGTEDVERAVTAAREAFEDGSPWRRMSPSERGRLIWRIGELIEEHADEFATLEALDNGKPFKVARRADIPLSVDLFRYMAGWATKIEGEAIPISSLAAPGEYHAYTRREPVGVAAQIIPWNFPLLMCAWKLRSLSSPVRRLAFEISERRQPPWAC
jgi:phenylacetaldehyde dehydrogenase